MRVGILLLSLMTVSGSCLALEQQGLPQAATDMGCFRCHGMDSAIAGPSWRDIAKRYRGKGDDPATIKQLVAAASQGSAGNWGNLPMLANDPAGKRKDKIEEVVKFVVHLPE